MSVPASLTLSLHMLERVHNVPPLAMVFLPRRTVCVRSAAALHSGSGSAFSVGRSRWNIRARFSSGELLRRRALHCSSS